MNRTRRGMLGWLAGGPLAAVVVPALGADRAIAALKAADAERLYAYAASSAVEMVAIAPSTPFLVNRAYDSHYLGDGWWRSRRPFSGEYAEE